MKTISGILVLLGIAFLGLFFYQNQEPSLEILLLGRSIGPFSLSTLMLLFYLGGDWVWPITLPGVGLPRCAPNSQN